MWSGVGGVQQEGTFTDEWTFTMNCPGTQSPQTDSVFSNLALEPRDVLDLLNRLLQCCGPLVNAVYLFLSMKWVLLPSLA